MDRELYKVRKKCTQKYTQSAPKSSHITGHYDTFLQDCQSENSQVGDDGQPSVVRKDLGRCNICKAYSFTSTNEKKRHISLFHRRTNTGGAPKGTEIMCNFPDCGKLFYSKTSLSRHKRADKHTARDLKRNIKPSGKSRIAKSSRKSLMQEIARQATFSSSDESESEQEEDELCEADPCKISNQESENDHIGWVACDNCKKWLHLFCEGLTEVVEGDYICKRCL